MTINHFIITDLNHFKWGPPAFIPFEQKARYLLIGHVITFNGFNFQQLQVEQACSALSSIAADVSLAMQLMKSDIMQPIVSVLKAAPEEVISVLQVVVNLAFASDIVAQKMLTKDILKSLKGLCAHKNAEASFLDSFLFLIFL